MRRVVVVVLVLVLVAVAGLWLFHQRDRIQLPDLQTGCRVSTDEEVRLDHDQMANAATITAVGVTLDMPDRAVVVALATALQESKLRNLPHLGSRNDHDSIGLFQQRPSQGWGSEAEISDPRYAAERFYLALREVDGWQDMRVTDAAQRVQRSAFPEAYQQWAEDSEVLAAALLGHVTGAVSCAVPNDPRQRGEAAASALGDALAEDWGNQTTTAWAETTRLSISADDPATGWRYAHWLVAHAAGHGVTEVHFADQRWSADVRGWSTTETAIDHVRAEVAPES
ncbi:hypothetical protein JQS43_07250 [Natronosporangium hydrolyticum]|uniref:Heavy metal transporter n=1 Tax=Natronosporangium hydrolyticum TaxID=2811111 RepID=A0A895YLB1_9ACTN|nr:hypothetical protein [Natronosporangium hydrolyticum]QSB16093.1 hypothetical protein JQS43_07250 [Natronosporangium hydrolyticum]